MQPILTPSHVHPVALTVGLCSLVAASAVAQSNGPCLQESIPADVSFVTPWGTIGYGRPLSTDGHRILLQVAESHATLFEPVGPSWHSVAELTPAPGHSGTYNGAVHGDRVAFNMQQGGVGFYERGPAGWNLTQTLQGSMPISEVLDLEADFALVLRSTQPLFDRDLVVLERTAAGWIEGANLGPMESRRAVLSGNRVALGSLAGATNPTIELLELSAGGVVQPIQSITPPPGPTHSLFGYLLALDGDRLVTTSVLDGDGNGILGSLLVYERGPAGTYQFTARIDDPPQLASIPGVVVFGLQIQLSGDRLLARFSGAGGSPARTGIVVFDHSATGWSVTSILDPSLVPSDSNPHDALMASGNLFLASTQPVGVVRRYSVEAPQGVQVCLGSSPVGAPPQLALDGCSSASTGRLVVRGEGMRGGALFFGLARGSVSLSPGAPSTCIRPAGALGYFNPIGPGVAEVTVDPQVLQSVASMFGDVLLLQAAERVVPPVGGVTMALSEALAIELGD